MYITDSMPQLGQDQGRGQDYLRPGRIGALRLDARSPIAAGCVDFVLSPENISKN
jgi:hypothetical protein